LHERSMHRVHIRHIHADLEKQSHAAQCVFHSLDRCPLVLYRSVRQSYRTIAAQWALLSQGPTVQGTTH
jgi:hypothetical protein